MKPRWLGNGAHTRPTCTLLVCRSLAYSAPSYGCTPLAGCVRPHPRHTIPKPAGLALRSLGTQGVPLPLTPQLLRQAHCTFWIFPSLRSSLQPTPHDPSSTPRACQHGPCLHPGLLCTWRCHRHLQLSAPLCPAQLSSSSPPAESLTRGPGVSPDSCSPPRPVTGPVGCADTVSCFVFSAAPMSALSRAIAGRAQFLSQTLCCSLLPFFLPTPTGS